MESMRGLPRYLQAREYRRAAGETLKYVKRVPDRARDAIFVEEPIRVDSEITTRRLLGADIKLECGTLVERMYNFKTGQGQDIIRYNADLAQKLLRDMNFIHPEPQTDRGPYRHPIIQQAIEATWFSKRHFVGDHKHFFPVPISIIALTLTVIQWCINEWSSGTRVNLYWNTEFQTAYDSHVSSLLDLQAHSPANNTAVLFQLQCDLSRMAHGHAGVLT
ncbi:hypothetical protein EDB86DRAFT_2942759 [Lactarius hatsudake]|nr:hypothetical protein EDB86DRAFT_2942759 [Lactarius hatsudake]